MSRMEADKDRGNDKSDKESSRNVSEDGRKKQHDYFKIHLDHLRQDLKKEASLVKRPEPQPFKPDVSNSLEPYYNTSVVERVIEHPDEGHHGFLTRRTAEGIVDPWISWQFDHEEVQKPDSQPAKHHHAQQKKKPKTGRSREGQSMRPDYPIVNVKKSKALDRDVTYDDVQKIRREMRERYSSNAQDKIDRDYKKTKKDFYLLDLHKLDEMAPEMRPHVTMTYHHYLENSPGSRKAIRELTKTAQQSVESKERPKQQENREERRESVPNSEKDVEE